MARMGRRTRLTPEIRDKIVLAVRSGAPLEVCAQSVGIAPNTFWEWMRRGEKGDDPDRPQTPLHANFAKKVREAEAGVHLLAVAPIQRAAQIGADPRVSMGWAKMRWAKHYADRLEVSGPDGGPMQIARVLEGMSDDDLDRLLSDLRARSSEGDTG